MTKSPDFSEWIIASDFDGTYSSGLNVPKRNIDAVNFFMEHGGTFTLCTGRSGENVDEKLIGVTPNAPMVCNCGSQVYDFTKKKVLEQWTMDDCYREVYHTALKHTTEVESIVVVSTERTEFLIPDSNGQCHSHDTDKFVKYTHRYDEFDNYSFSPVYKMVFLHPRKIWERDGFYTDEIYEALSPICEISTNTDYGFETTSKGINKGNGVRYIKELYKNKKVAAIGDYHGDMAMLRGADLAFAPSNAPKPVKELANHVVCDCRDGALADMIDIIAKSL